MNRIKDVWSFLYPIKVDSRQGELTTHLEVIKFKGKNVLNGFTVNYSFGGLHIIFDQLFKKIEIEKLHFKNVLILGMGAGSIVSLLEEKYKTNCHITAIEKDKVIIELAKKYFNIDHYKSLKIINMDAFEYTHKTNEKYDLIISDLFIESNVPKIFETNEYLLNLKRISNDKCCIIINKMTEASIHKKELTGLFEKFVRIFPGTEIYKLYANNAENSLLYYNTLPIESIIINSTTKNNEQRSYIR